MKCVGHYSLESGTSIFQEEGRHFVSKSAQPTDEGGLVLIGRRNINLVVTRKAIHKQENITPSTIIDELVNKGRR